MRQAPNAQKSQHLQVLEQFECREFCELRKSCSNAYRRHQDALDLLKAAKHDFEERQDRTPLGSIALGQAEQKLGEAKLMIDTCITQQADARKGFR